DRRALPTGWLILLHLVKALTTCRSKSGSVAHTHRRARQMLTREEVSRRDREASGGIRLRYRGHNARRRLRTYASWHRQEFLNRRSRQLLLSRDLVRPIP